MKTFVILLLFVLVGFFNSCDSKKTFDKSLKIKNRILDQADLLTPQQEDSVFNLIENLELKIGSQLAFWTIDSLGGQRIEEASLKMAESLGLGRSTHNDGLLITISFGDRKARIEVGTGLENIIKDEIAARIIREDLAPKFKDKKYGQALYNTVDKVSKLIVDNKDLVGQGPR